MGGVKVQKGNLSLPKTHYTTIFLLGFDKTIRPKNWQRNVMELDPNNTNNNGYKNEDLIVWMRTAALPTFRKLYRRIQHTGDFASGLPKGTYELNIDYSILASNIT